MIKRAASRRASMAAVICAALAACISPARAQEQERPEAHRDFIEGADMSAREARPYRMHVLSHTHWDREWYQDFQGYRRRLVYLTDALLDLLDTRESFRCFHFDGQTCVLLDYLEVKPRERARLEKHIRDGRIVIGPWFVMPDEANLSGESLVRNLMLGHRLCAEFGGKPMPNGFVSDIFSHVSQMPQIFRMFGLDSAYFYRGTPCADEQSEMVWEGADGTETLVIKAYPEVGYQDFMEYRDGTPEEIRAYEEAKLALATTPVLYGMDGNDHQPAKWDAPEAVERANGIFTKTVARHSSWPEYLADLKAALGPDWTKGRKRYVGELRFPAKAGTWTGTSMGTGSSRPYLKQANDEIENLLARVAEPLHAWAVLSKAPHHQEFLGEAWKQLLLNHPHDSICGCSIDQAHRDMVYRFDQARLIGRMSVLESVQDVGDRIDTAGLGEDEWLVTVYNMAGAGSGPVTAFAFEAPTALVDKKRAEGLVPAIVGADGKAVPVEVVDVEHAVRTDAFIYKTRGISPALRPRWDLVERYHVLAEASVPALGYASWRVAWLPEKEAAAKPGVKAVKTDAKKRTMENEHLRLRARDDGSVDLYDKATRAEYRGIHVFEDVGDAGNGWDHGYPKKDKVVLSSDGKARGRVRVTVEREGRLAAAMKVAMTLRVPADLVESKDADGKRMTARSGKTVAMPIETTFTLVAGARRVECRTVVDNVAKRHRLRVMMPTGRKADTWQGDSAFDIVTRDIALMDTTGWKQHQREEHVIKNFAAVCDGRAGLAVLSKGLNEATVRDDRERTLALTLFRSFAQTLNGVATTDSLILGRFEGEYAIEPFTPENGGAPAALLLDAEAFKIPAYSYTQPSPAVAANRSAREFSVVPAIDPAAVPELAAIMASRPERPRDAGWEGRLVAVDGPVIISTVKLSDDRKAVVARVWNPADRVASATLTPGFAFSAASITTPLEGPGEALAVEGGKVVVPLKRKEVVTIRLEVQ